ncbi:uncharacterized protein LOC143692269 [Agelaius phoeniceus]|uniref:uncharacterized protein LOC143692269 n=1 Tax=Agelaius phoeniceus TaxID=39638 RepID=UPI004055110C
MANGRFINVIRRRNVRKQQSHNRRDVAEHEREVLKKKELRDSKKEKKVKLSSVTMTYHLNSLTAKGCTAVLFAHLLPLNNEDFFFNGTNKYSRGSSPATHSTSTEEARQPHFQLPRRPGRPRPAPREPCLRRGRKPARCPAHSARRAGSPVPRAPARARPPPPAGAEPPPAGAEPPPAGRGSGHAGAAATPATPWAPPAGGRCQPHSPRPWLCSAARRQRPARSLPMHGGAGWGTRRQLRADPRSGRCLRLGGAPAAHVIARLRAGRVPPRCPGKARPLRRGSACRAGRRVPRPAETPCGRRAGVAPLSRAGGSPLIAESQHTLTWKGQGTHVGHRVQLLALLTVPSP